MAVRTATPLLTTTLAIAAATAAIMVGCTRHAPASADAQQAGASGGTAYDPATGQTVPASASPGALSVGDGTAGSQNTTGNAATGVTQPGAMGESNDHGAPSSSSAPQSR